MEFLDRKTQAQTIVRRANELETDANPLRERLGTYGFQMSNMMDAGVHRPEISLLILDLYEERLSEIEKTVEAISTVDDVMAEQERAIQVDYSYLIYKIMDIVEGQVGTIQEAYDFAHYVYNVLENRLNKPEAEHTSRVERLLSFDREHLPDEEVGFLSPLFVTILGGIENWMRVRDFVYDIYQEKSELAGAE